MTKTITITKEGRVLWTGNASDHLDAIKQYRAELGAEALDYDAVSPRWIYDLEFDYSDETGTIKVTALAAARFADLTEEFNAWRTAHGIKGRPDAYKLLKRKLSPADRAYLRDFVKRWEARCIGDA